MGWALRCALGAMLSFTGIFQSRVQGKRFRTNSKYSRYVPPKPRWKKMRRVTQFSKVAFLYVLPSGFCAHLANSPTQKRTTYSPGILSIRSLPTGFISSHLLHRDLFSICSCCCCGIVHLDKLPLLEKKRENILEISLL
jgi:hypothetical protein